MNEPYTIYTLNNECIVSSLTADLGNKQHLAVPHLSVLKKTHDDLSTTISSVSSYLSGAIGGMNNTFNVGIGSKISSITQTGGMINVGTKPFEVADISAVALIENDFLKTFADRRIDFSYDSSSRTIYLGLKKYKDSDPSKMLSIDCNDFIKDGMLSSVTDGKDQEKGPYIKFSWNTDGGPYHSKPTTIYVKDVLGGVYKGINPIVVDNSLSISLNIESLRNSLGYNELYSYYEFLAGLNDWADKGAIKTLSDDVSFLREFGVKNLKYIGHIKDPEYLSTQTLTGYFGGHILDLTSIYNGAFLPVSFNDDKIKVSTTDVVNPLVVGNGDIVIIHDHGNKLSIDVEDLKVGENVYVLKAGVSRYEFEELKPSLSTEYIPLSVEGQDAVSVITGAKETDGIIHLSASVLTPTMISGFRDELDKISCTVTICSALSDFDVLTGINTGDIAIVSVANGVNPLSSGYSVTGYVWRSDISNWVAMNGNYNAKNIYFDYDIIEAGAWTGIGNISHTANTVSKMASTDKSLAEVMDMIFKGNELFPNDMTVDANKPSCTIRQKPQFIEVGKNVRPQFTLTFDKKTYKYGSNSNSSPGSTTNVSPKRYRLTYKDKDNNISVLTGNYTTNIIDSNSFIVRAGTNSHGANLSVDYDAAADGTYIPKTSLGRILSASGEEKYRATSGQATTTSDLSSIIGYYPNIYGFATLDNEEFKTDADINYSYLSGLTKEIVTNTISANPNTGMIDTPLSSLTPPASWLHFFYALPDDHPKKLTGVKVKSSEAPFNVERKRDTVEIPFDNNVKKNYKVFFIRLVVAAGNAEVALTWESDT